MASLKDSGVHQRNTALEHIELHKLDGVLYFADDDNLYSLELFQSLRQIIRFGTWPVAMLAPSKNKAILEGPICNGSQVETSRFPSNPPTRHHRKGRFSTGDNIYRAGGCTNTMRSNNVKIIVIFLICC
ncbi:unnamed protein product [Brassica rapa]|uniref:Glycosyltransferases n=2 Tax=Brassica TaxID=3705 RepID=A0A078GR42_BRANA|nr:unnamed protein product [Brassica napus]CAG7864532.1 unnamed protein product [Brassica rapa]CDY27622.1 BnaA09g27850D [Brassica napus]